MKRLFVVLFCAACLSAFALSGIYYVKIDADGYITDITSETGDASFMRINFTVGIPEDILCGCYKYSDGAFIRDEAKYSLWLATRTTTSTPDAIGGGE